MYKARIMPAKNSRSPCKLGGRNMKNRPHKTPTLRQLEKPSGILLPNHIGKVYRSKGRLFASFNSVGFLQVCQPLWTVFWEASQAFTMRM